MTERQLRVVALTPTAVLSGAERVLIEHAVHGRDRGDHWTVLAPAGATGDRVRASELELVTVPELKLGGGPRPLAALALALRNVVGARAVARAVGDADVIVANSVMVLPLLRLVRPSAPVVWLVHDVITRGDLRRVARLGAPVVARSVAVSRAAGELSRELGLRTDVVYNGVDVGVEPATTTDDAVPIVGLNGVLTHWKGHHVLLDATGRLERPLAVELLGGALPKDGAYEQQLRDRADEPDLRGRVRIVGHRDDPATTMRRWSIAVSASVEPEAGSLAVLEAMALGLPIIVSDHGGAPEMLGDAGVTVPVDDPVALATTIDSLLDDPDRRAALGRAARRAAIERFRREDRQDEFRSTLHEVAGHRRSARR